MSRLRVAGYLATALVLAAIAFIAGTRWGPAPSSVPTHAAQPPQAEAPGVVVVPKAAQAVSGLATAAATATVLHPTASAYAVALDVRPLLAAQRQIATAASEARTAESAERASRAEYERARALFADDRNISQKAMQSAEAAWHADQGKVQAATAALHETEATAVQQFGAALAGSGSTPPLDTRRLASRQEGLVQVILPASAPGSAPDLITLTAPGYAASRARLVAPSPQVDASASGRAFLYRSETAYPSGLRLQAELPLAVKPVSGFRVPESAVVWYGNEAWVFVQSGADRFVRRALKEPQAAPAGVFTTTPFAADEPIVTRGAQLLQSESLRPKTPEASGCADPECD